MMISSTSPSFFFTGTMSSTKKKTPPPSSSSSCSHLPPNQIPTPPHPRKRPILSDPPTPLSLQCPCGRRHVVASWASLLLYHNLLLPQYSKASIFSSESELAAAAAEAINKFHPQRPEWYQEFYAQALHQGMASYEAQIAGYKEELFSLIPWASRNIVELGVGTGPNFKYYANTADLHVIGIDPNEKMEKYAKAAAATAGLPPTNFTFMRGVGEALPLGDNSADAVVGTLVLCSVKDVDMALKEVRRVLRPGGHYLFIEHVAASDGRLLRLMQALLDPLQQFVSDGCHLSRETGRSISEVGFSSVSLNSIFLANSFLISPHIYGIACK